MWLLKLKLQDVHKQIKVIRLWLGVMVEFLTSWGFGFNLKI
jgi:hypothetical protein